MKTKSEDYEVSLLDIINMTGRDHEQSRESCIDDSGAVHSDSPHAGGASHHESTHSHPPYSSDIRKRQIEKEEEQSKPTVERGVSGKETHSHSPYSSEILNSTIDNDTGVINHTSTHHDITNSLLPPYSSDISSRQADLLRTIASIGCKIGKQDEQRPWRTGVIYQQSYFENDISTSAQLMARLRNISQKTKGNLERLYKACGVFESMVADGVIEEVAIATTGVLAQVFSKSTAAEVIHLAERVDLLFCTNSYYCPSTPSAGKRKNGTARKYVINPRMLELVKRTYRGVSSRGRAVGTGKDGGVVAELEEVSSETIKELLGRYNICLSSSLRLPACLTDEQVRACIHARYPQLTMLDTLREQINTTYYADKPPLQLRQRIKISRGKTGMISKIGTRCTSGLCLLRANDIPHGYAGLTRHMFLKQYYGGRAYYEHDIKSSIYRVARFLRTGEWLAGDMDFYSLMSPYEFADEQERSDYKKFAMRLYFGGSPQKITSAFFHELRDKTELERKGYTKREVEDAVGLAQARMFSEVGASIGSEVFLHEGAIYLMVLDRLLGMGMRAVSVYDEFIADDPRLAAVCEELLPVVAAEYRARWC